MMEYIRSGKVLLCRSAPLVKWCPVSSAAALPPEGTQYHTQNLSYCSFQYYSIFYIPPSSLFDAFPSRNMLLYVIGTYIRVVQVYTEYIFSGAYVPTYSIENPGNMCLCEFFIFFKIHKY
jgi:hypothetical protein